jgi:hypothetical protein
MAKKLKDPSNLERPICLGLPKQGDTFTIQSYFICNFLYLITFLYPLPFMTSITINMNLQISTYILWIEQVCHNLCIQHRSLILQTKTKTINNNKNQLDAMSFEKLIKCTC